MYKIAFASLALALFTGPAYASSPESVTPTLRASQSALVLAVDWTVWVGAPGIGGFVDHVREVAGDWQPRFMLWGTWFYVTFFAIQFLLLGITMVVKGPFAIATYRPIHALNPFANFFFFLIAGTLGFMLVSNSTKTLTSESQTGWVPWLYTFFEEAGRETGCMEPAVTIPVPLFGDIDMGSPCDEDSMAWIGTQMSGILMLLTDNSGNSSGNNDNFKLSVQAPSFAVFSAYTAIAIQLALTKIAFILVIVTAPIFLSTIIFKPLSGIADGFVSVVVYLGVKLFILSIVAGIASYVAETWFTSLLSSTVFAFLSGAIDPSGGFSLGDIYSFSMSVTILSLLLLSLTLYLPTKVAGMASQRLNVDLNGILFRGDFPVQIA